MDMQANSLGIQLPAEPYPGLRPFQPHEAALLFGREKQVREVIERLRQTQFVAVIGGSGSGKSSLIHAGVVPELRSFGIPGAGDFWVPMAFTPGTNVSDAERAAGRHTPITRLARKFASLLRSRGSAEEDAARIEEIALVFRQEAGFARLLDAYADELDVPRGPDPKDARLLFVIDQFEELFHPTNRDVEDCRLLVERVIDHFFNPHPRCYVVLTMRSEHLNDCAGYLELPDAINKSSYLVRRLDGDELRDAIVGPAQRYLRLLARQELGASTLPQSVQFEPAVIDKLLSDVQDITADSDHLPLLQHLLARLWQAARARSGAEVPAEITWADLSEAASGSDKLPYDVDHNLLQASLDIWAERLFRALPPAQQPRFEALLRQLAYKDPNTGMFSQQRVEVGAAPVETRALIESYLAPIAYLFWDDENPDRVTLKVWHESFIRGWRHFRALVEREAERFEEFAAVLRKCEAWTRARRAAELLLETGELRRLADAGVEATLANPAEREAWFRFLLLDRDGPRLAQTEGDVDAFIAASKQALRKALLVRRRNLAVAIAVPLLVLVGGTLYSALLQSPVTDRAETLFSASARANQTQVVNSQPAVGAAAESLDSLLRAAEQIDSGRQGSEGVRARLSTWLLAHFSWLPPVARQEHFIDGVASQAEPPVNERLRRLLASALWKGEPRGAADAPIERAEMRRDTCYVTSEAKLPVQTEGRLLLWGRDKDGKPQRGVFLPDVTAGRDEFLSVRGAGIEGGKKICTSTQLIMQIPLNSEPRLLFDADLRHVLWAASGAYIDLPSVRMFELDWERAEDGQGWSIEVEQAAEVTDPLAVEGVRTAAGKDQVAVLDTWTRPGGRSFSVGAQPWRVIAASAQPVEAKADALKALPAAGTGSPCDQLLVALKPHLRPGLRHEMYVENGHCFAVQRGNVGMPPDAQREALQVAVYGEPDGGDLADLRTNRPAPLATLPLFYRAEKGQGRWLIGTQGDLRGWIALQGPEKAAPQRVVATPWSTCALWRLGRTVVAQNPVAAGAVPDADRRAARAGCESE